MHLIWPQKFRINIVFNFSWDGCNTQEKWKTKVMQNFRGQIWYIMGDVQVVNWLFQENCTPIMLFPQSSSCSAAVHVNCRLTLMTRLSSDWGGLPVHTANLQESSATCSVTPNSKVCEKNQTWKSNKFHKVVHYTLYDKKKLAKSYHWDVVSSLKRDQ